MWLTRVSIKNPYFATVLMLALLIVGLIAANRISVEEFPDINFQEIDIEKESLRAQSYGVMSIPTYVIEMGDEEIARLTGVQQKSTIEKLLRE